MKHPIKLVMLVLCIAIFASCSKKTTETFAPTETYHPPKTMMSATDKESTKSLKNPTTQEGIFWIGSSMNHNFSIESGSISLAGVYAINNKENLEKDALGNLQFYPKKSLSDMEFFNSEIGNLDYEEGIYYKVEGTKYYLGSKLWGVIVNKVLHKADAQELGRVEDEIVTMGSKTKTTKRWQNTKTQKSQTEPEVMVSSNPPRRVTSIFWISSSKYYPVRDAADAMSASDGAYAVLNERILPRNSSGQVDFQSAQVMDNLTYHPAIGNLDHEKGYYYKVEGTFTYSGTKLMSIYADKVLQKLVDNEYAKNNEEAVIDFEPTTTWHPRNEVEDGSNKQSKTTNSWQTSKKTTTSSTSTNTTKRTKTNKRWQDTKTKKDQSRNSSEVVDFTPTETWHPENDRADGLNNKSKTGKTTRTTMRWRTSKKKIKSTSNPSILDGIFWIGSTRNHSFSMKVGAVSVADAYAINLSHVERKRSGAISRFYPIQNMENFNFFDGEIENLDYEEGNYYKVEGSLHYEDKKLSKVKVDRVLEKVKDNEFSNQDMESPEGDEVTTAVDNWPSDDIKDSDSKPISMVSENPPEVILSYYTINSSKEGALRTKNGPISYTNRYAVNKFGMLQKNSSGNLAFFDGNAANIEFVDEIKGMEFEEGYLYQVSGYTYGSKDGERGLYVHEVEGKVEDKSHSNNNLEGYEVTEATHPHRTLESNKQKKDEPEAEWAVSENPPVYIKPVEMIIHIGPGKIRSTSSSGQQIDCLQVQYDKYSRSTDWSALCKQIRGFEPEASYQYTLKVRRTTSAKIGTELEPMTQEEWYAADDYELITVIRKRWVR